MTIRWCVFLCTILLCSTLQVSAARGYKGGSHSYPKSGGLSGSHSSSGHSYPNSRGGGLSGNGAGGQAHAYPSSGGQSHAYPSSGGQSHGYPSSGGQSHGYPSSGGQSHGYPSSGGLSGNSQNKPISGNTHTTHTTTNVYNNYHYSPPQQIRYTPTHGYPQSYPVYHGSPPNYVYQYKDSGSKYGTLLAGLALLNLGTLGAVAYSASHNNHGSSGSNYKAAPGEVCKFGVKKDNGDYEETRIDCQLITSFIFQAQDEAKAQNGGTNTTVVTTSVTNVTMVSGNNGGADPAPAPATAALGNIVYTMLLNGTLVPLNGTLVNGTFVSNEGNATSTEAPAAAAPASSGVSSVTTTTTNTTTTVVNALDVKGKPVDVTPGMQCYVIRNTPTSNLKKSVPCGLLQSYATQSLKKNSATRNLPVFTVLAVVVAMVFTY